MNATTDTAPAPLVTRARNDGRLPHFLIIGAAKSGTTALASYLAAHPGIYVVPEKELHFFDTDHRFDLGLPSYARAFTPGPGQTVCGEATPDYLWSVDAPERIARSLPGVRLVALLRNPVDRAYSQYWHVRGWGGDDRSFSEVLNDTAVESQLGLLSRGLYHEQIQRYLAYVPAESLLVLQAEDLRGTKRRATLASVVRHLGVEIADLGAVLSERHRENPSSDLRWPWLRRTMVAHGAWDRAPRLAQAVERWNVHPVRRAPMDPAVRLRLLKQFAEPNAALAEWWGRDLSAWSR
jgi:hypothetical protein